MQLIPFLLLLLFDLFSPFPSHSGASGFSHFVESYSNHLTFNDTQGDVFQFSWDVSGSILWVGFGGRTSGWVAVGVGQDGTMASGLDIWLGYWNGTGVLRDYTVENRGVPLLDEGQDLNLLHAGYSSGWTFFEFKRELVTDSSEDWSLLHSLQFFSFAIGDLSGNSFVKHDWTAQWNGDFWNSSLEIREYHHAITVNSFSFYWTLSIDTLQMAVEVLGSYDWISVGINGPQASTKKMEVLDCWVGTVLDNGTAIVYDYWNPTIPVLPILDQQQDIITQSGMKNDHYLLIEFDRKFVTTDSEEDLQLDDILLPLNLSFAAGTSWLSPHIYNMHSLAFAVEVLLDPLIPLTIRRYSHHQVVQEERVIFHYSLEDGVIYMGIQYNTKVQASGYISAAFSPEGLMNDMDCWMAYFPDGEPVVYDYYSNSKGIPVLDSSQDWTVIHGSQQEDWQVVEFSRPLTTSEPDADFQITDPCKPILVSLAYSGYPPTSPAVWDYHLWRDTIQITLQECDTEGLLDTSSSSPQFLLLVPVGIAFAICLVILGSATIIGAKRVCRPSSGSINITDYLVNFDDIERGMSLGRGEFGEVFYGMWKGTEVAIKMIPELESPSMKGFMYMMTRVRHPNVCMFLGANITPPDQCLLLEYLKYGTLSYMLRNEGMNFTPGHMEVFLLDTARGMNYLHLHDPLILHQDLKCQNLLVDENLHVKVSDYGLRSLLTDAQQLKSVYWAAPEILNKEPFTKQSDVYSFGICMFEIISRKQPYDGVRPELVMVRVLERERPSLDLKLWKNIPPTWLQMMESCWSHNPELRPSFSEIIAIVDEYGNSSNSKTRVLDRGTSLATVMEDAPTNTAALIFTDIQNSTELWEANPTTMKNSLNTHNSLFRRAITKYKGYEVKTEGDAFMISFHNLKNAIAFCINVQLDLLNAVWSKELKKLHQSTSNVYTEQRKKIFCGIRVRMGIHWGEVESELNPITHRMDYFGHNVNLTARISGLAKGGEILMEKNLWEIFQKNEDSDACLIEQIHWVDVGKFAVKGIQKEVALVRLLPKSLAPRSAFFDQIDQERSVRRSPSVPTISLNKINPSFSPAGSRPGSRSGTNSLAGSRVGSPHQFHTGLLSPITNESWASDEQFQSHTIEPNDIEFLEEIGVGGYGSIFKATWKLQTVSVKVMSNDLDTRFLDFRSEIHIFSKLSHPHVVQFIGLMLKPKPALVMEFMEFGSMDNLVFSPDCFDLTPSLQLRWAKEIALGMHYLHDHDPCILHCDLKLGNALVNQHLTAKVSDFGSALMEAQSSVTQAGTLDYLAPELFKKGDYSVKTDVYSYGILLWALQTRKKPFPNSDSLQLSMLVCRGIRPPIPEEMGTHLRLLITSCWDTNPDKRPVFSEIADVIFALIEEQSGLENSPVSRPFSRDSTTADSPFSRDRDILLPSPLQRELFPHHKIGDSSSLKGYT